MLERLPDHIGGCMDRAVLAQRRAAEASDPAVRYDYEQIARDWRNLASSYELTESLEQFIIAIEQLKEAADASTELSPRIPDGPQASRPAAIGLPVRT